ncbi:MAG TPA: hypothetical protein VG433_00285, partial [Pirellulales bacterium]|nr:hypothetical protein [Pirellulales bacterium]
KVLRLKRIALGPVRLKDLEPGDCRRLSGEELRDLRYATRHHAGPGARPDAGDQSADAREPRGSFKPKKAESPRRKQAVGRAPKRAGGRSGHGPKRFGARPGHSGR